MKVEEGVEDEELLEDVTVMHPGYCHALTILGVTGYRLFVVEQPPATQVSPMRDMEVKKMKSLGVTTGR